MAKENIQVGANASDTESTSKTPTEVQQWLKNYVAELMEVAPETIDIGIPFDRYGLDSSAAIGLTGDLEDWLGIELDPTLLYDYPTIKALTQYLTTTVIAK
ncbi:acyl carrier protein [Gloeocapsa sp. PCC 73106]|uniref:acyl carrier protein n=1 Tax=Gloeocapsa sp. PCC 73106 TaxID=102232 RepID=UPI0002ABD104|nr:acyl carrier protein [Gloeocapsa sp. PCC 73106]ELR96315.1 acyl carrier protein [Gloeocapsa sp. PCC 73106]ELR99308.1 acyl carrier protein [Gloeocapsa sp. PCC 73106]